MKRTTVIFFLSFTITVSYAQLFNTYGEREYTEELNVDLLKIICKNSDLAYSSIYFDHSYSKVISDAYTFYSIRYITKKLEFETLYTTKFLLVDAKGTIIKELSDPNLSYSTDEVLQPYATRILSKLIPIRDKYSGIGIITEFYSGSRISLYSEQLLSIILLDQNNSKIILKDFPIRKTNGESNGMGNYELETMENSMYLETTKSHDFYDLKVVKDFKFEENLNDSIVKNKHKKDIEFLKFTGKSYTFKAHQYVFLDY